MNRLIRTELFKQRTLRTTWVGVAAVPSIAGLVTVAVFQAAGRNGNDPLGRESLVQAIGAPASIITVIALMLGVLVMTGEYRHQTITTTFLSTPRRRDVVIAKLGAQLLTGALIGASSVLASAAVALPWLRAKEIPTELDSHTLSVAAGVIASAAVYGTLGVSVGALIRNQTVAIAAVLVWLLAIEGAIGQVFHDKEFVRWLPVSAGRDIVGAGANADSLPGSLAALVFCLYVALFAVAATFFTIQRDVI
jgi:ABC-2 type transport system permease protein